jgi:hypothetical protein
MSSLLLMGLELISWKAHGRLAVDVARMVQDCGK